MTAEPKRVDLSDRQREAVMHTGGPLLVLAGAGSGKTRVITHRAVRLVASGADPWAVLAITFTNRSANEMRERIEALGAPAGMTICTFHAWCARTLRIHHERAGLPPNFTIYDRDDSRKLLAQAIDGCGLSAQNWTPARVDPLISHAKNRLQGPKEFAEENDTWENRPVAAIYARYQELLLANGAVDFDDLLLRTALLLNRDEGFRASIERRYQHLLIDEYQDTNAAQYAIARALSKDSQQICVVGDPDQSIYAWRGADIGNILTFEQDYPGARVIRLEQNYRSTKRILAVASGLIERNQRRREKSLWTENEEGAAVRAIECDTSAEESLRIAEDIAERVARGASFGHIAIFYRVNWLSRSLEESLIRRGVPYRVARGTEFYNRKEIKDVLAYLRVIVNPADTVALFRVINTPTRGIGQTTVARLKERAEATRGSVIDVLANDRDLQTLGRSAPKVRRFGELLAELSKVVDLPAAQAIERVVSLSGLRAHYGAQLAGDASPIDNIDELISAAHVFGQTSPEATLQDWLEHTALLSDIDALSDDGGMVTLLTLHAAKGLEFPEVYMVGLEDGILPFCRDGETCRDEEEERRLCFVGMTRAMKRLTMTWARYRMHRGREARAVRSRFLDELPEGRVEWIGLEASTSRSDSATGSVRGELPADIAQWRAGTLVRHRQSGLGQILSIERGSKRTHVRVQYQDGSEQAYALEFADLERVDFDDVG